MSSPQGQPAKAAPSKKGGSKLPLVAVAVLLLAGGGVVAFRQLNKKEEEHAKAMPRPLVVDPGVIKVEPFILNLADPAGDRYFRLNLRLVLDQKEIAERASTGLAQAKLRDSIMALLAKKRAAEMTSTGGKEALRTEIQAASEALLSEAPLYVAETDPAPAHVLEVFFTEFLVQ